MQGGGAPERLKAPVSKTRIAVARVGLIDRRIGEVTSRLDLICTVFTLNTCTVTAVENCYAGGQEWAGS
jgi:hypothetical protein